MKALIGKAARLALGACLLGLPGAMAEAQATGPAWIEWPVREPADLLELHHEPESATDRTHEMFFDEGAWHGYALPAKDGGATGFVGPFLGATDGGRWAGRRFGTVRIVDAGTGEPVAIAACDHGGVSLPGALARRACGAGVTVTETLFYAAASATLVRVKVVAEAPRTLRLTLGGSGGEARLTADGVLTADVPGSAGLVQPDADGIYSVTPPPVAVRPGRPVVFYLQQNYLPASQGMRLQRWSGSPSVAWSEAGTRWRRYLAVSAELRPDLSTRADVRRISAKAVITLLSNWRAPLGDLLHAGVFPSYSNPDFNAFWSWDSWKHAAALASFAPELAKDQVRAIFDYQLTDGMIPDNVTLVKAKNNLRDSKPPLASWAVMLIFRETGDRRFVAEMFDRLYRYHRWWYADRDHDADGLAEYGSTDGTPEAARWESGMDNAVRFDGIAMLRNGPKAWSMDQESVDLNSYLYQDKIELAGLARVLGKREVEAQLRREAVALRSRIQTEFFDSGAGYFFDVKLGTRARVMHYGPEGWIPLWTGVASEEEARGVADAIGNPEKFNTQFPLPTLAKNDPHFSPSAEPGPESGYWRGPVWIDQAVFGLQGLARYGLNGQMRAMEDKLFANSPGLTGNAPFRETYDPLSGAGQNSRNFSWSAAEFYLLVHRAPGERSQRARTEGRAGGEGSGG